MNSERKSINRSESNSTPSQLSNNFTSSIMNTTFLRRSRDMREEIINQRMITSFRLENANLKAPKMWKQKEDAYFRFREMKKQLHNKDEKNKSGLMTPTHQRQESHSPKNQKSKIQVLK